MVRWRCCYIKHRVRIRLFFIVMVILRAWNAYITLRVRTTKNDPVSETNMYRKENIKLVIGGSVHYSVDLNAVDVVILDDAEDVIMYSFKHVRCHKVVTFMNAGTGTLTLGNVIQILPDTMIFTVGQLENKLRMISPNAQVDSVEYRYVPIENTINTIIHHGYVLLDKNMDSKKNPFRTLIFSIRDVHGKTLLIPVPVFMLTITDVSKQRVFTVVDVKTSEDTVVLNLLQKLEMFRLYGLHRQTSKMVCFHMIQFLENVVTYHTTPSQQRDYENENSLKTKSIVCFMNKKKPLTSLFFLTLNSTSWKMFVIRGFGIYATP
jgi:hypothetical protein